MARGRGEAVEVRDAVAGDGHGDYVGFRERAFDQDLLPRIHRMPVHPHNAVADLDPEFLLRRIRRHVTDHRGIDEQREAGEIDDRGDGKTEHDVHERAGERDEDFVQRRRWRDERSHGL